MCSSWRVQRGRCGGWCHFNPREAYYWFWLLWLQPADIYLIDEPSAYLDSEQRIVAAKVIKRFILHAKKTAFVVEHDFIMATYLADRVIVYEGQPSIDCIANTPQSLLTGMNLFLSVSCELWEHFLPALVCFSALELYWVELPSSFN